MHRVLVMPACETPCASCVACRPGGRTAALDDVLAHAALPELLLGGGDATAWPPLQALLAANARRDAPQRIWVEAPAVAFTPEVLAALAKGGAHGVLVQIEGVGEKLLRAMRAGDGEQVIAAAEALGLETQARICARPKTFPMVAPLARRLAPRRVWLELVRQNWGEAPVPMWPSTISQLLLACPTLNFSGHRMVDRGYLPPCTLPHVWETRPTAFRTTLRAEGDAAPNRALPACDACALRTQCRWSDRDALTPEEQSAARPIVGERLPWDRPRTTQQPVPLATVRKRPKPDVICVTPWTDMEVVDPDGRVRQCCSTWTAGDRGNVIGASLAAVWNGPGYQAARRQMSRAALDDLCLPICSRLHDEKYAERELRIQDGSATFVLNQLLMAEDIAERREIVRSKPLRLAICPSTYCNYNCIMCDHGRTPRRELPEQIWDELPELLPTLQSLTLLGGEPLANPLAMKFLRAFDVAKYPDCAVDFVTNGALLTDKALEHLRRCTLGDVTMSLNAGTPEVYERVQRGIAFDKVLANLDGLLRFRDGHHRWFGITVSFVVQPAAAHTLIEFGELAHARNLRVRLMALNPENHEGLDFYLDDDAVAGVLGHVDRFIAWAGRVRPEWLPEIRAARSAVVEEAARRRLEAAHAARAAQPGHLPIVR